ncbi:MAG: PRC-barrel domain-containing protein, partial [Longimicrobiales bacterium]
MPYRTISDTPDYRMPAGFVDVRGWEVRTDLDDEKAGKVTDVVIDDDGAHRYLEVDLGVLQKHVLLPLDRARIDPARRVVWTSGMDHDRFEQIPEYDGELAGLEGDYASRLEASYARVPATSPRTTPTEPAPDAPAAAPAP